MTIKTYAQVNIGRNVDGVPMDASDWDDFIRSVRGLLVIGCKGDDKPHPDTTMVHLGEGRWINSGGEVETEDSAYISIVHKKGFHVDAIREMMRIAGDAWRQEYVAVIFD